ncbi:MAG: DciA family protein [Planctomycetota bacterium]
MQKLAPAKGSAPLDKIQQVRDLWEITVGKEIAQRSVPKTWREGVLTVMVDSAPLAAELQSFGESALITTLVEGGLQGLHSIRFQSGKDTTGVAAREGCEN